ncbi:MAG TPA: GNAT family N-acetyltransferase [Devosiaceae bacterium]|jgi:ribosomal protein S18 acetylase RimI-like enzyme
MSDIELKWRVEEACHNSWPSPRQLLLHGWVLRFSGGATRRTNSVNPLRWERRNAAGIIQAADSLYGRLGQQTIFRMPEMAADLDAELARRGYTLEEDVAVLVADLDTYPPIVTDDVQLHPLPDAAWLKVRQATGNLNDEDLAVYQRMIDTIVPPKCFASVRRNKEVCSIAYGVVHDSLLVIESCATVPEYRQQGMARRAVGALMEWGRTQGADTACLQLVADNHRARALYERIGFTRDLYHYHYRRAPIATGTAIKR